MKTETQLIDYFKHDILSQKSIFKIIWEAYCLGGEDEHKQLFGDDGK